MNNYNIKIRRTEIKPMKKGHINETRPDYNRPCFKTCLRVKYLHTFHVNKISTKHDVSYLFLFTLETLLGLECLLFKYNFNW